MSTGLGARNSVVAPLFPVPPKLLVELEPRHRIFFRNLWEFWQRPSEDQSATNLQAEFWPDVFVPTRIPWERMLQSVFFHVLALLVILGLSQVLRLRPQPIHQVVFRPSDVIYYSPSEYLPPVDTGSAPARTPQNGQPAFAKQRIISVPPEADNHTQTIITPPNIKLSHDVAVPNIVAWDSVLPAVPLPAARRTSITPEHPSVVAPPPEINQANARRGPEFQSSVIAPPPDTTLAIDRRRISSAEAAVIAPPPTVQSSTSRLGDINIGDAQVVAPAPQLPMGARRSTTSAAQASGGASAEVVPPPPSAQGVGTGAAGGGRIIALGIHPAAGFPPEDLAGNRRGSFSATPSGKAGAPGTPDIAGDARGTGEGGRGSGNSGGAGTGTTARAEVPPGVFVGPAPTNAPVASVSGSGSASNVGGSSGSAATEPAHPKVSGDANPMRVTVTPHRVMTPSSNATTLERQVFGNRKFYSMVLNMPNLNSAGGSWVIRFAEAKVSNDKEDLTAPEPTHKVDPAYPLELMRMHLEGTVALYAIIKNDGTVSNVRVLTSVDERLDEYARAALARWKFIPATRNGSPVDLEAVVMIPFRAKSNF